MGVAVSPVQWSGETWILWNKVSGSVGQPNSGRLCRADVTAPSSGHGEKPLLLLQLLLSAVLLSTVFSCVATSSSSTDSSAEE